MIKRYQRIVCVLLIVLMAFMLVSPPKAQAFTIVGEGALLLLVASMLTGTGMVFASDTQAQSAAMYAINNMSADMVSDLQQAALVALEVGTSGSVMGSFIKAASIGVDLWSDFGSYVTDLFDLVTSKINGFFSLEDYGLTGDVVSVSMSDGSVSDMSIYSYDSGTTGVVDGFDFSYNGYSYRVSVTFREAEMTSYYESANLAVYYTYDGIEKTLFSGVGAMSYGLKVKFIYNSSGVVTVRTVRMATNKTGTSKGALYTSDVQLLPYSEVAVSNTTVLVDSKALEYSYPDVLTDVKVAVPEVAEDLIGLAWSDVVINYDGVERYQGVLNPDIPVVIDEAITWGAAIPEDYVLPSLTTVFPFCIPFDLIALVGALNVRSQDPVFEIPINMSFVNYEDKIVLDLTEWDTVAAVIRWGVVLVFILGLIIVTRKMIQG